MRDFWECMALHNIAYLRSLLRCPWREVVGTGIRHHVHRIRLVRLKNNKLLAVDIAFFEQRFGHVITFTSGPFHRGYFLVMLGAAHGVEAWWGPLRL